jgi:hypothetical protein
MKYCQSCGKRAVDNDIICPDPQCRGHLDLHPPVPTPTSAYDVEEITRRIWNRIWKKHLLVIFGEFSLLMAIGLFGLYGTYLQASSEVKKLIIAKIDGEFKTERIRTTISDVAAERAGSILEQEVRPAVIKLTNDIGVFSRKIDDLVKTKEQQDTQIATLNSSLGVSKIIESNLQSTIGVARTALNELDSQSQFVTTSILADHDDRQAYERLIRWRADPSFKYRDSAGKIASRIQAEYFSYTGAWDIVPWAVIPNGTNHDNWGMRDVVDCWRTLPSIFAKNFIDFMIGNTNIMEEQRLSFLRQAYLVNSRNSLYAEQAAAYHMASVLQAKYNPCFVFDDIEKKWTEFTSTNHLFAMSTVLSNTTYDIIIPSFATNRFSILRSWGNVDYCLLRLNHSFIPGTLKGKWHEYSTGITSDIDVSDTFGNIVFAYFRDSDLSNLKFEFCYQADTSVANVNDISVGTNSITFDHSSQITIPAL